MARNTDQEAVGNLQSAHSNSASISSGILANQRSGGDLHVNPHVKLFGCMPTSQQFDVIRARGKRVKIRAFAGTGKSSTTVMYAKSHPDEKILVLTFNKAAAEELKRKAPFNMECRTGHSLAYAGYGSPYRDGKGLGSIHTTEVVRHFKVSPRVARQALDTLNAYLINGEKRSLPNIKDARAALLQIDPLTGKVSSGVTENELEKAAYNAQILWRTMLNQNEHGIKMSFDGYFKIFLIKDEGKVFEKYDTIIVDEAQDTNEALSQVIEDAIAKYPQKRFMVVGDSRQSIYGFRGARDFLQNFNADEEFILSKSFRFGRGVALCGSLLLDKLCGERNVLEGLGPHPITSFSVDVSKPYAIISRTNAELFDRTIDLLAFPSVNEEGRAVNRKIHFVGGPEKYRLDMIVDAYRLWCGADKNMITNQNLRFFQSWEQFKQFCEDTNDAEFKILKKVVEKHQTRIPELVAKAKNSHVGDTERADVVVGTAHSVKGAEFDQVIIANDFPDILKDGPEKINQEEANLLYVAVTRAKRALALSPDLDALFTDFGYGAHIIDALQKANLNHHEINLVANQMGIEPSKVKLSGPDRAMDTRNARSGNRIDCSGMTEFASDDSQDPFEELLTETSSPRSS